MNVRRISETEYEKLYNERLFNPPDEKTPENKARFEAEFEQALEEVRAFCAREFKEIPKDEDFAFNVWSRHNWSRVVDVELRMNTFLEQDVVERLQAVLRALPEAWMVILWNIDTLFISPVEVLAHLTPDEDLRNEVDTRWIEYAPGPLE